MSGVYTSSVSIPMWVMALLAFSSGAIAQQIYWSDPEAGVIQRANLDGSNVQTVIPSFRPLGVAVDSDAGKVYWTDVGSSPRIQRSNLDGTQVENIRGGLSAPYGLAIAPSLGKVYWTEARSGMICRANLNGSSGECWQIEGVIAPRGIAVDEVDGHIYWVDIEAEVIRRAKLDGTEVRIVVSRGNFQSRDGEPEAIALDVVNRKIYWVARHCLSSCFGWPTIRRANLDGSNRETLIIDPVTASMNSPKAIAIDSSGEYLYWTNRRRDTVQRMRLGTLSIETLVPDEIGPLEGIAFDTVSGRLIWADNGEGLIRTIGPDAPDGSTIYQRGVSTRPYSLAIDDTEGKLYWSEIDTPIPQGFFRSNVTGSMIEELTPSDNPYMIGALDLEIDPISAKLYWGSGLCQCDVCYGKPRVTQSNLDLTGRETLLSWSDYQASSPTGLALDVQGNNLYWAEFGGGGNFITCSYPAGILRMNLDSAEFDWVIPLSLRHLRDLEIDQVGQKLYWTLGPQDKNDPFEPVIQRSNLDGSNVESIISVGLVNPNGIALDGALGKIYWTDSGATEFDPGRIMRANIDGTGAELLVETTFYKTGPTRLVLLDGALLAACCDGEGATCVDDTLNQDCLCERCLWFQGTSCEALSRAGQCQLYFQPIPTVSEWGLGVFALLLLIMAKIRFAAAPNAYLPRRS